MGSLTFNKCRQKLFHFKHLLTSCIIDELNVNHCFRGYSYLHKGNSYNQRIWNINNIYNNTLYSHIYLRIYESNAHTNSFGNFSSGIVLRKLVCSNCKKDLDSSVFCKHCNSIQQVDKEADYFQIVGIKKSYQIDNSDLKSKYHKLQSLLHPDKFSSKSKWSFNTVEGAINCESTNKFYTISNNFVNAIGVCYSSTFCSIIVGVIDKHKREQELSEECSSVVNKAYWTLLHPLERGLYLLSLHNITIEEGTTEVDNLFLMEIMERNEEIESVSEPQKLNELQKNNKMELDKLTSDVTKAFDTNDLSLAKKLLTKMKYYNTIDGKIKEIKQKLNIPD